MGVGVLGRRVCLCVRGCVVFVWECCMYVYVRVRAYVIVMCLCVRVCVLYVRVCKSVWLCVRACVRAWLYNVQVCARASVCGYACVYVCVRTNTVVARALTHSLSPFPSYPPPE